MRTLRSQRARVVAAGLVSALLASSCGGGSGGDVGQDVTSDAPTTETAAPVSSATTDPATPDPADQEEHARAIIEAELADFDLATLDAKLAEAAARDAAFPTVAELLGLGGAHGFRRAPAQDTVEGNVGAGLFGGALLAGMGSKAIVGATNKGDIGTREAEGVVINATKDSVELTFDKTHESDGLTSRLKTHVKVFPCPDANGQFTVDAKVDVTSKATGSSSGQESSLEVSVTGQLDDDARLAGSSMGFRMHRSGLGLGSFVDVTYRRSFDGTWTDRLNDFGFTTLMTQVSETAILGTLFAVLIEHFLLTAAEAGYESGRCVQLDVAASPGPSGLDPGSASTITAKPRSKIDGSPTGGTVTALLTAGVKAVDPSSTPIPADAEFTYSASDEYDESGTVSLEARSKRGVGKAEITLDTKRTGYVASGTGPEVSFSGEVQSITEPFSVNAEFVGGNGRFDFFPDAGGDGGKVGVSGSGGGATMTGSGTYTATKNGDGTITLNVHDSSCVEARAVGRVVTTCRDHDSVITLTPTSQT